MSAWSWLALILASTLLGSGERDRRRRSGSEPTTDNLVNDVLKKNLMGPEERRELASQLQAKGLHELARKVRASLSEQTAAERLLDEAQGRDPVRLLLLPRDLVETAQRELGVETSGWYDVPTVRALRRTAPGAPAAAWLGPVFRTTGADRQMGTIAPTEAPAALAALAGAP